MKAIYWERSAKDWDFSRLQSVFRGPVAPDHPEARFSERGSPLSLHIQEPGATPSI
ncbi:MAG TPA: hypothetical protein PLU30_25875 [Verrucomicrobiae bacterium]|nr:hypothetical protein [Verrucomicrobiae bacterium]